MNLERLDIKKISAVLTGLHWTNTIHVKFILHTSLIKLSQSMMSLSQSLRLKNVTETGYHG